MRRSPGLVFVLLAAACRGAGSGVDDKSGTTAIPSDLGTGFATGPWEEPTTPTHPADDLRYQDAYVRILSPASGDLVPWGEPFHYELGIFQSDGTPIDPAGEDLTIAWFASGDPDFSADVASFDTSDIALGVHDITALVDLPSGDRLAYSVGDVAVQSPLAGTYAGLFSVDGSVNQLTISCTGAAVIIIDAEGQAGQGEGSCIVSLLAIDIPMTWDFSLDSAAGALSGEAGVDLLGIFSYNVPMTEGTLDPAGDGLALQFAGPIPLIGDLSAFLDAPRVSLDAGL